MADSDGFRATEPRRTFSDPLLPPRAFHPRNPSLHCLAGSAWDVWPYPAGISSVTVSPMTSGSMTNDLTECIWKELTTSLGDAHCVKSVQVREGWGEILYVTLRGSRSRLDESDDLDGELKSTVAIALGDIRYAVKIDWNQPPEPS